MTLLSNSVGGGGGTLSGGGEIPVRPRCMNP